MESRSEGDESPESPEKVCGGGELINSAREGEGWEEARPSAQEEEKIAGREPVGGLSEGGGAESLPG